MALIAYFAPGEHIDRYPKTGLALIFLGALFIVVWHASVTGGSDWGSQQKVGQILFLAAAFVVVLWAAELALLRATAVISINSLVAYLPLQLAVSRFDQIAVPVPDLALQVAFQGILVTIV